MALVSHGYPTDIGDTNIDWATMQRGLGRRYWVGSGFNVSPSSSTARTVNISAGWAGACGITDENTSVATLTLPTVSTGTRWYLVGVQRNWNTGSIGSTFTYIDAGTSNTTLPTFPNDGDKAGGTGIDFQPLGLASVTAGQTQVGSTIDLRVMSNSGQVMLAQDERVLQYYGKVGNQPGYGQQIKIGNDLWTYEAWPTAGWVKDREIVVSGPGYGNALGLEYNGGWTTVTAQTSYGRRSRSTGWHQLVIRATRSGSAKVFNSTTGGVTDDTDFSLSNTEWRPPYLLTATGEYRSGGASYGCSVIYNPDGTGSIISGAPGTEISRRTDGDWSFRVNFEWMSAS